MFSPVNATLFLKEQKNEILKPNHLMLPPDSQVQQHFKSLTFSLSAFRLCNKALTFHV